MEKVLTVLCGKAGSRDADAVIVAEGEVEKDHR